MQNTSSLYKELIKQSGRLFKAEIAVTFPNGSRATLTDENIMQDSLVITSGRSDEGSFSIGNAITGGDSDSRTVIFNIVEKNRL